jgi:hypothetical protein
VHARRRRPAPGSRIARPTRWRGSRPAAGRGGGGFAPGSPGLGDPFFGDETFLRIPRDWAAEHRYGNALTAQFIALAERDSGRNLEHFFNVWPYRPEKPTSW